MPREEQGGGARSEEAGLRVFSVDLEEWFHFIDCPGAPNRQDWDKAESRVQLNLNRLLVLLDRHGVTGTFFVLGWVADRHPALVAEIHSRGHEVASHGYAHEAVTTLSAAEFRRDLDQARRAVIAACGVPPIGYRAPGFSITRSTGWALDVIRDAGFTYDSSMLTCPHPHGGNATRIRGPHVLENGLVELPVTTANAYTREVPLGGGYLRVMRKGALKKTIERAVARGEPLVSYVHPADCDPEQPRLKLPPWRRFKSYVALPRTVEMLELLLSGGVHCTMAELAAQVAGGEPLGATSADPRMEFTDRSR